MVTTVLFLTLLPIYVTCSGEGNIRLLEQEVATALNACSYPTDYRNTKEVKRTDRERLSENSYGSSKMDDTMKQVDEYKNEKRNISSIHNQMHVLNDTAKNYATANMEKNLSTSNPETAATNDNTTSTTRIKRSDSLFDKPDSDQCLSQCVFANLQVVDPRGIPREAELWNKIQNSVTSQQSRSALRDQIRACFQELQSEEEENGCSYSNKLERCLMLRFADRKGTTEKPSTSAA